jgi:uncharacterized membrane protein
MAKKSKTEPRYEGEGPSSRNIRLMAELERDALASRTFGQRVGDLVSTQAGRFWFVVFHIIFFTVWIGLNVEGASHLDPYPFPFLTLVVSLESIFLSLFILMSQNRASRLSDRRAHFDLQVNLLAEAEMTKVLNLLQAVCAKLDLPEAKDPELAELARETSPTELIDELKQALPDEG